MEFLPTALDPVALGRWQFAITTVYHFILVPLTIGLSLLVAIMQTFWYRTGSESWLKATRFFGKLLLINFALGVATGIVQEFQFGMNWSEYSRYVGDIFGAPLAIEALLAFFLESTFLGIWIFGWGRISRGMHLAMIWLVAIGTMLSALWILTANAWMQLPVGAIFNPATGRAELDGAGGFLALIASPMMWWTFSHVITSSWFLAGTFVAGISIWWMTRSAREGGKEGTEEAREVWLPAMRVGLVAIIIGGLGTAGTGHFQGQELVKVQPAMMAAAEGICMDTEGAAFTIAQFGGCPLDGNGEPTRLITVPGVTSFMSHNSFSAEVEGVQNIQERTVEMLNSNEAFVAQYGDASQYEFIPPQMVVFWSFRIMIGFAAFAAIMALWALWATRQGKIPTSKLAGTLSLWTITTPFIAASAGWIFTEVGRQPWVVYPNSEAIAAGDPVGQVLMMTELGISTAVPAWQTLMTLILFTVLYGVLGVIWYMLMRRYTQEGVHSGEHDNEDGTKSDYDDSDSLVFGY